MPKPAQEDRRHVHCSLLYPLCCRCILGRAVVGARVIQGRSAQPGAPPVGGCTGSSGMLLGGKGRLLVLLCASVLEWAVVVVLSVACVPEHKQRGTVPQSDPPPPPARQQHTKAADNNTARPALPAARSSAMTETREEQPGDAAEPSSSGDAGQAAAPPEPVFKAPPPKFRSPPPPQKRDTAGHAPENQAGPQGMWRGWKAVSLLAHVCFPGPSGFQQTTQLHCLARDTQVASQAAQVLGVLRPQGLLEGAPAAAVRRQRLLQLHGWRPQQRQAQSQARETVSSLWLLQPW